MTDAEIADLKWQLEAHENISRALAETHTMFRDRAYDYERVLYDVVKSLERSDTEHALTVARSVIERYR